ncbi:MAG: alpha-L-fucosidase [Porphyromonadaceae bacterium]|nr:MAG: alpha-L-fucosidase [Porphyromonadaceae bacterium]
MRNLIYTLGISMIFMLTICSPAGKKEPATEDRMQWWDDAKFGMFIHWGIYSVPAGIYNGKEIPGIGEWIMNRGKIPVAEYRKYSAKFNPDKYDPNAWVKMAKDAGMKYIVITSKHHDGFALFDSKVTDWDVVDATPYGKDLLKPLAEACKREGIKLGFYYSQAQDWVHPGGSAANGRWDSSQNGSMDEYIKNIAVPQVEEILSNYGEVDILWWDTPVDMNKERAEKFLPVLAIHPKLITNNRLGGGMSGDTETPEQFIPSTGFPDRHWEVCMTMNDTWGYKSNDHEWKSTKDLVLKLSDIVSKGGNFLLNVGPTSEGEIPKPSVERLKQVGEWMKVNHEAIYATQASPFPHLPWGKATLKEHKLYLHVVSWPKDGILKVPLKNKALSAWLLADPNSKLELAQDENRIEIKVSDEAPDSILSVVVLQFEGAPETFPVPSAGKLGTASSVDSTTVVKNLFDGDPKNLWKPALGERRAWVEVDLGEPLNIGSFTVVEPWNPWDNHGQEFTLQYKNGDKWVDIVSGKTNGCGHTQQFEPVTGRYFRLNIAGAKDGVPVLNEWVLNRSL